MLVNGIEEASSNAAIDMSRQERKKWEEEEAKFSGSEKKAGVRPGEGGGRWTDRS